MVELGREWENRSGKRKARDTFEAPLLTRNHVAFNWFVSPLRLIASKPPSEINQLS